MAEAVMMDRFRSDIVSSSVWAELRAGARSLYPAFREHISNEAFITIASIGIARLRSCSTICGNVFAKSRRPVWQMYAPSQQSADGGHEKSGLKWVSVPAAILVLILVGYVIYREATREVILIDPFGVPKALVEIGYSPQGVANRIADDIDNIERSVKTSSTKDHCLTHESTIPDFEVPETHISLRSLVQFMRGFLRKEPTHISGEIAFLPLAHPNSPQQASPPHQDMEFTFRVVDQSDTRLSERFTVSADDINLALTQLSRHILKLLNPYMLAVESYNKHEKTTALALIQDCIHYPNGKFKAWGYLLWSDVLMDDHRYEEAIQKCKQAIDIHRKSPFIYAYVNWGEALRLEKDPAAQAKFEEALRINPDSAEALNGLGNVLMDSQQFDEALPIFERATQVDPKFGRAYTGWGWALSEQPGKQDEAIAKYLKAIEIDPTDAYAYVNLGVARRAQGDQEEARRDYEQAMRIDPQNALAYNDMGNLLLAEKNATGALKNYEQAIEINPEYTHSYYGRGIALRNLGQLDKAGASFQKALELRPRKELARDAHNGWGGVLRKQGKWDEAIAHFQEAIRLDPADPDAYTNWGCVLQDEGKFEDAAAMQQQAITVKSDCPLCHENLGHVLYMQGQLDQSASEFERAINLNPKGAGAYNGLGKILLDRGEYEAAIAKYEKAIELDPDDKGFRKNLARARGLKSRSGRTSRTAGGGAAAGATPTALGTMCLERISNLKFEI